MIYIPKDSTIKANGDLWIVRELERVRLQRRLLGGLPAFRRGQIYYDFDAGKVRVAPVEGGAA